jgi:hypothetical protein
VGCDIHLYVERRVDGVWTSCDTWTDDKYDEGEVKRKVVEYQNSFWCGHNYNLFAILANVRNGYGFAGFPTGEGFQVISEPRGLPSDCCELIRTASDEYGVDGHSHSYHTLAQLLNFNWTQYTVQFCVINGPEFVKWNSYARGDGDMPFEYCGDVDGPGIVKVAPGELEAKCDELLAQAKREVAHKPLSGNPWPRYHELAEQKLARTYARFGVRQPYHRACAAFWSECIPRLLALGKPDDVRIVFWFDN